MLIRSIATVFLLWQASACGKVESSKGDTSARQFDGKDVITVSDQGLYVTGSSLSGSGSVVFRAPLGESGSNKGFRLQFTLADGGSIDLISHAYDNLSGGNTVRLVRSGQVLQTVLTDEGKTIIPHQLTGIAADTDLDLLIDVHNSETPAHILIWNHDAGAADDDNALFNSDADADSSVRGYGNFWGLSLNQASVTAASAGEARFGH
jgi:hypothetical protein